MSLGDDLRAQVTEIFKQQWTTRKGEVVPEDKDLKLSNDAVEFDTATILYADLSDSTKLVAGYNWDFAAEVYKSFLQCAARVTSDDGGTITAYDGDRLMAVFTGGSKNSSAARTALKINYCVREIVNPLLRKQYPESTYSVRQVVGVDTSAVRVARTGIRGANDLVWVGRAANYAAKLCALPDDHASYVTSDVYDNLRSNLKNTADGQPLWEQCPWTSMGIQIYRSNWWWAIT